MTVATKKVTGRRTLHFDNLQQVLDDAEQMARSPVRVLGNWTQGKIYQHLANTMNASIDGWKFAAPWYIRVFARMMKQRFLNNKMQAGFKLPPEAEKSLLPEGDVSTEQGLEALRRAIHRQQTETKREPSPAFGPMSVEDYNLLHQRHAELHLSFLVPEQ